MKHPKIALDLDGVVADFHSKLVEVYNQRYEPKIDLAKIDCEWDHLDPTILKQIISIFNEPDWFINLQPLPGAIEAVSQFLSKSYDVTICTAPARDLDGYTNGLSAAEKFVWIKQWLPDLAKKVIVTRHKELIKVDMLIDDTGYNITAWSAEHPRGIAVLIDQPWNKSLTLTTKNYIRTSLADVTNLIDKLWCPDEGCFVYTYTELANWKSQ